MKKENKKIRNATEVVYNGIAFKSKSECAVYRTLKEKGLDVDYEPVTFTVIPGFKPTVPFYNSGRRIKKFRLNMKKALPLTYTPDFIVIHDENRFIVEVKGFENDVYPLKRKLFRRWLEEYGDGYAAFFEIHNKKELLEAIDIIKSYEKKS